MTNPVEESTPDTETTRSCPKCGEEGLLDSKFCEACGFEFDTPVEEGGAACVACESLQIDADGYCESCGYKQPEERDHKEFESGLAVAVTDKGRRHRHNEDAVAVGVTDGGSAVLVVCDGVSSTSGSAEASLRAVIAARDYLITQLGNTNLPDESAALDESNQSDQPIALDEETVTQLLVAAAAEAQAEASLATADDQEKPHPTDGPPSATFVAAIAQRTSDVTRLSVAWLGDSRAYWLGTDSEVLTTDHEVGGSLVRWIGADSPDPVPEIAHFEVVGEGNVLLCSDGLWRYAETATEMAQKVNEFKEEGKIGVSLAAELVAFANDSGGHDNISVALWPVSTDRTEEVEEQDTGVDEE